MHTSARQDPPGGGDAGALDDDPQLAQAGVAGALTAGEALSSYEMLTSPNGELFLTVEGGALRVSNRASVTTFRSHRTDYGRWDSVLRVQGDGNLVIYRGDGTPAWHTHTNGHGPVELRLQDDGNLVLYNSLTWKPLWNSEIRADASVMTSGDLRPGMSMFSPYGERQLVMQGDGNLVMYSNRRALWNSGTFVPGSRLVVDGSTASVRTPDGRTVWTTPRGSAGRLVMQDDGNTVMYAPNAVWHTNTPMPNCSTVTTGVTPDQVVRAANGVVVHPCVASSFNRMVADAKAQGVDLRGGGYRDPQQQIAVRKANCGTTHYDIYLKPSSECTPPTARPGNSMHEKGLAVDFTANSRTITTSSAQFVWLSRNAADYGFYNLPSEPWHWSTNGN